jgi:hypothetical protein
METILFFEGMVQSEVGSYFWTKINHYRQSSQFARLKGCCIPTFDDSFLDRRFQETFNTSARFRIARVVLSKAAAT